MVFKFKSIKYPLLFASFILVALGVFLTYSLAGLGAKKIEFAPAPSFVTEHARALDNEGEIVREDQSLDTLTSNFEAEETLVLQFFFEDKPVDALFELFAHPERTQRVKIATAFSAVNIKYSHDEESGFPDRRKLFWQEAALHLDNIRNALFEALEASAKENTQNYIPYTLAWMPMQGEQTLEMFAWASKHHPDWWIRRFAVYFIADSGQDNALAKTVLRNSVHDPDYRVRKEVLQQRYARFF
jgi:hypothetical protein